MRSLLASVFLLCLLLSTAPAIADNTLSLSWMPDAVSTVRSAPLPFEPFSMYVIGNFEADVLALGVGSMGVAFDIPSDVAVTARDWFPDVATGSLEAQTNFPDGTLAYIVSLFGLCGGFDPGQIVAAEFTLLLLEPPTSPLEISIVPIEGDFWGPTLGNCQPPPPTNLGVPSATVRIEPVVSTESSSWGGVKALYR